MVKLEFFFDFRDGEIGIFFLTCQMIIVRTKTMVEANLRSMRVRVMQCKCIVNML